MQEFEPASPRLKGEHISISANPAILAGDAGIELEAFSGRLSPLPISWAVCRRTSRVECICHLCQSPLVQDVWIRTKADVELREQRDGSGLIPAPGGKVIKRALVFPFELPPRR